MVIPPVVVSAGVPVRAVTAAAVLIEMAKRPERDTGQTLRKSLPKGVEPERSRQPHLGSFLRIVGL